MGCDIHMFVERKQKNGDWVKVGNRFIYPYYNSSRPPSRWNSQMTDQPYFSRNYFLFALLANVRNDGSVIPMGDPRGIPDNVSKKIRKMSCYFDGEYEESDWHSHSWFTLKELQEYDYYKNTVEYNEFMNPEEYLTFLIDEFPTFNSGHMFFLNYVDSRNTKEISEQKMNEMIDNGYIPDDYEYKCKVKYQSPYYNDVKNFVDVTIPILEKIGKPDDVRIVFWFDN